IESAKRVETEPKIERSTLAPKIIPTLRLYVPLVALSRIKQSEPCTISRIQAEIDTLIRDLKRKIPDITYEIPSEDQLSSNLKELEQLGTIDRNDELYILTEEGRKVLKWG
ncbi:MAG: hypothetical protein O7D34_02980, partial [Ignavibacteria bacterium]|nr:hypothetical protein [Ignavibacteria bacterium]